jgi:hypothetical protein
VSKQDSQRRKEKTAAETTGRRRPNGLVLVVFALAAVALVWLWNNARPKPDQVANLQATNSPSTNADAVTGTNASTTRPEFQKLAGIWLRSDGDYALQIRSVDNLGAMDAAYFNPAPIHVSKAAALRDNGATQVFIELQDANYPGCTYTLVYDPATDRLSGDYFQAAIREHYQVEFTRKPAN